MGRGGTLNHYPPAGGKGVVGNHKFEGSGTANSGPDEQEPHKRLDELDKQAHHCDVRNTAR